MYEFEKGDRVEITDNHLSIYGIHSGDKGTVDEDESTLPWVIWDGGLGKIASNQDSLKSVEEPHAFKKGDKVEIIRKRANPNTGSARGWNEGEDTFKGRIGYVTDSAEDGSCTVFSTPDYSGDYYGIFESDEIKSVKETHMYEEGQILVREKYGVHQEVKVLAVSGLAVLLSYDNDFASAGIWYTPKQIDDFEYKLKQEVAGPEVKELTIEEIAEKFEIDPAQVRIKKEA